MNTLLNEKAGVFATHLTPAERIRKARQRGEPGVFHLEKPARLLFNDFEGLSRLITARHYREVIGFPVPEAALAPVSEFVK